MITVTGATGQLGRLVIKALLARKVPASEIIAAVRSPTKAQDLATLGVQVREADYDRPDTLAKAFAGTDKLLLISSSAVGKRVAQHRAVVDAGKQAGVKLLAYTSILHADTSPMGLAVEHKETEALIRASATPFVLLRHGWYTENYTGRIVGARQQGAIAGCADGARMSPARRADFAEAAAVVLTGKDQHASVYELAGDTSFTLAELAAEISRQLSKPVVYKDLPEADYKAVLIAAGLPEPVAALLAQSDVGAAKGGLFDDSHQLSRLIGRPTASLADIVSAALKS